jgi:ABC-type multidrug transport system fused ATPase/permease subunit
MKSSTYRIMMALLVVSLLLLILVLANSKAFDIIIIGKNAENITIERAMEYLDEMESSHQQFVDKPEKLQGEIIEYLGDLNFHKEMVKRYQELREFMLLEEKK